MEAAFPITPPLVITNPEFASPTGVEPTGIPKVPFERASDSWETKVVVV